MSTMTDDELAVALARSAVERAAPEELVIFPAASEAFLEGDDPSKKTRGDPMLGIRRRVGRHPAVRPSR